MTPPADRQSKWPPKSAVLFSPASADPCPAAALRGLALQVRYPVAGMAVVSVCGVLDDASLDRFAEVLRHRLASVLDVLVLDLSAVSFLSASGLQLLNDIRTRAHSHSLRLKLVARTRPVWRALQVAGLDTALPCHTSALEALAASTHAPTTDGAAPADRPRATQE